ncbi:MAG: glycosyltransferase family 4 protein [Chlorobiaceae bacterium]|nr:glycosyltransferase family 4 protein [Chlorobiaceae bacterium]
MPPGNPEALAHAIETIIDNHNMLLELGKSGFERVNREFTMSAMVDNLETWLLQKIRQKNRYQAN